MCCIKKWFVVECKVPMCLHLNHSQQTKRVDLFGLGSNGSRLRASHWILFSKSSWVNLRNCFTGWILHSFRSPVLQLEATFTGLTGSIFVILTWLVLFIKLHNPFGFFFLPVWDTVCIKKPQSLHNSIARKSKCFLGKSKNLHLDLFLTHAKYALWGIFFYLKKEHSSSSCNYSKTVFAIGLFLWRFTDVL